MPYLSPPTLTRPEQDALLQATRANPRDHLLFSLALGTGLRLSEITGLNVGDLFTPQGQPRSRMRLRREIAKGGRAGDVFLPDALMPKLFRVSLFWTDSSSDLMDTSVVG
jgi:integrase